MKIVTLSISMTFFVLCVQVDLAYAAFHDEEWGVPEHDDKYVST